MRTATARRWGRCPECGQPITLGAPIRALRLRPAVWAHIECAAQHARDAAADDLDAMTYGYGR